MDGNDPTDSDAPADAQQPPEPEWSPTPSTAQVFVGDGARRRRWLRAAAVACALGCVAFFGAIVSAIVDSPVARQGTRIGRARRALAPVVIVKLLSFMVGAVLVAGMQIELAQRNAEPERPTTTTVVAGATADAAVPVAQIATIAVAARRFSIVDAAAPNASAAPTTSTSTTTTVARASSPTKQEHPDTPGVTAPGRSGDTPATTAPGQTKTKTTAPKSPKPTKPSSPAVTAPGQAGLTPSATAPGQARARTP